MRITVNGEARNVTDGALVSTLLESLALPGTRVAIEVNTVLVRRAQHATHLLAEGDAVEIVTLVGGG